MSRRCMITDNATNEKCLGHPPVDDERYPAICDAHFDAIFGWLVEQRARAMANDMLHEMLRGRPRGERYQQQQQPRAIRLRAGATLNDEDNRVLDFLRGAA